MHIHPPNPNPPSPQLLVLTSSLPSPASLSPTRIPQNPFPTSAPTLIHPTPWAPSPGILPEPTEKPKKVGPGPAAGQAPPTPVPTQFSAGDRLHLPVCGPRPYRFGSDNSGCSRTYAWRFSTFPRRRLPAFFSKASTVQCRPPPQTAAGPSPPLAHRRPPPRRCRRDARPAPAPNPPPAHRRPPPRRCRRDARPAPAPHPSALPSAPAPYPRRPAGPAMGWGRARCLAARSRPAGLSAWPDALGAGGTPAVRRGSWLMAAAAAGEEAAVARGRRRADWRAHRRHPGRAAGSFSAHRNPSRGPAQPADSDSDADRSSLRIANLKLDAVLRLC
jgi:hypothetical protein